eukprot:674435-Prymnesium_polylepis.1
MYFYWPSLEYAAARAPPRYGPATALIRCAHFTRTEPPERHGRAHAASGPTKWHMPQKSKLVV